MKQSSNMPPDSPEASKDQEAFVNPQSPEQLVAGSEISLLDLWLILWRSKWLIAGITAVFIGLSIPYALMQVELYRASVLLAPAEERSAPSLVRQLGGLVSLAGVTVGGGGSTEPLAILRSRDFTAAFIEEQNLLPVLFPAQWDPATGSWIGEAGEQPDMRDAVELFTRSVLFVSEDTVSGLVTLTVQWTDPQLAATWADLLVDRLNAHLRERALVEAEANVAYLRGELSETSLVTLQQSVGRLLEEELQKVMLARGNKEFAFRVIDRAEVPKMRYSPNRRLIVVLATLLGGMFSVLVVFTRHAVLVARERIADQEVR